MSPYPSYRACKQSFRKRGLSKKRVCYDLDIEQTNFNRYYRDEFQRIDVNLHLKLCKYFDCAVDFTHIYDFVEDIYCADNGHPSVAPVVLFKMVLIQHLYGIPSLRRTSHYSAFAEKKSDKILIKHLLNLE